LEQGTYQQLVDTPSSKVYQMIDEHVGFHILDQEIQNKNVIHVHRNSIFFPKPSEIVTSVSNKQMLKDEVSAI